MMMVIPIPMHYQMKWQSIPHPVLLWTAMDPSLIDIHDCQHYRETVMDASSSSSSSSSSSGNGNHAAVDSLKEMTNSATGSTFAEYYAK
jgi:hypothetical protein